ncbi:MAG: alpha-1,6-glucosidase domain-containing protein [Candidatus Sericytochromatia bacterium]
MKFYLAGMLSIGLGWGAILSIETALADVQGPLPAQAHWLNRTTLAWKAPVAEHYQLCHQPQAQMYLVQGQLRGGAQCIPLQARGSAQTEARALKHFSHLAALPQFELPSLSEAELKNLIQQQLWLVARNTQNHVIAHTALQLAPLLDAEFSDPNVELGLSFGTGQPLMRLWAPTAQNVELELFQTENLQTPSKILPLQRTGRGSWQIQTSADWKNSYYRYRVTAFRPDTGKLESHSVTDPYSVSLAADSTHSQIIDLADSALQPEGWAQLQLPPLAAPEDSVIYELHLRDFSISDPSVPEALRGKYTAFSLPTSTGMRHLSQLAQSGLSHIHLLPVFDIATIPERFVHTAKIPSAPPDSPRQQEALALVRDKDAFNWGYDPLHYGAPEGSYASDPQGPTRIKEFRQMVQSLAQHKLRTVMDVVYNHTHTAGNGPKSVLDKIVPGYYYRLDTEGRIQQSTCCPDTATEHRMMEKLMRDTILRWAKAYKVAGFRFDLMGHHTRENLKQIRADLDALTLEKDGIEGKSILLYGEGWKFGSLDAIQPQNAMNQVFGSGLGIGMFNDRLRDSARGGNYDHSTRSDQGFATGLYTDPNLSPFNRDTPTTPEAQIALLRNYMDNLQVGLAGGLADFPIQNALGQVQKGQAVLYRGNPGAGFAHDPQETINYVEAHDNYSLWDQIAAKAPFEVATRTPVTATAEERMQMQALALSLPLLGQGIPFLHAGSELLRSKSGDGDSYDSGDWFNLIDWTGAEHGWGRGLPPAWRNAQEWDFWKPRLPRPELKPDQTLALTHLAQIHRYLRIRSSSPLFRLRTAPEIIQRLRFHNTGPKAIPGLLAMEVRDDLPALANLDQERKGVLVIWNATQASQQVCSPDWAKRQWETYSLNKQSPLLDSPVSLMVGESEWLLSPLALRQTHKGPWGQGPDPACLTVPSRSALVYHEREDQAKNMRSP